MIHTWHKLGCTYDMHVCTCVIVVHNKNLENHSVLSVLPEVYIFILACTAHVRCIARVRESESEREKKRARESERESGERDKQRERKRKTERLPGEGGHPLSWSDDGCADCHARTMLSYTNMTFCMY